MTPNPGFGVLNLAPRHRQELAWPTAGGCARIRHPSLNVTATSGPADTGLGVLRQADAGYELAVQTRERYGLGLDSRLAGVKEAIA